MEVRFVRYDRSRPRAALRPVRIRFVHRLRKHRRRTRAHAGTAKLACRRKRCCVARRPPARHSLGILLARYHRVRPAGLSFDARQPGGMSLAGGACQSGRTRHTDIHAPKGAAYRGLGDQGRGQRTAAFCTHVYSPRVALSNHV